LFSAQVSLVFGTTGLTNFAHGELVTFGALVAWWLNDAGLPVIAAAVLAVIAGGVRSGRKTSASGDHCKRGTGLIALMIISIA
jgi:branched-chain amino acid transport system permease protein